MATVAPAALGRQTKGREKRGRFRIELGFGGGSYEGILFVGQRHGDGRKATKALEARYN
jgi:hypothetical protein